MFRRYTTLHILITTAAFSVAAVWIILSATRHSHAKGDCEQKFFTAATPSSEAETMCQIFPWVDVGIMGGLWVLLAISQVCKDFFVVVLSPDHFPDHYSSTSISSSLDTALANALTTKSTILFIP